MNQNLSHGALDELARLADDQVPTERMGVIRARARRRQATRGIIAAAAAAGLLFGGIALSTAFTQARDSEVAGAGQFERPEIVIEPDVAAEEPVRQVKWRVVGEASRWVLPDGSLAAHAMPSPVKVLLDDELQDTFVLQDDFACDTGTPLASYDVTRTVDILELAPGDHVVTVEVAVCEDGTVRSYSESISVNVPEDPPTLIEQQSIDLDGDNSPDTFEIWQSNSQASAGMVSHFITWSNGDESSHDFPAGSDPPPSPIFLDLDGDGIQEFVINVGGGDTALYEVYSLREHHWQKVTTVDAAGNPADLVADAAADPQAWHVHIGERDIVSYLPPEPTLDPPFSVLLRAWSLDGLKLTEASQSIEGCARFPEDGVLVLDTGPC